MLSVGLTLIGPKVLSGNLWHLPKLRRPHLAVPGCAIHPANTSGVDSWIHPFLGTNEHRYSVKPETPITLKHGSTVKSLLHKHREVWYYSCFETCGAGINTQQGQILESFTCIYLLNMHMLHCYIYIQKSLFYQ